MAKEMVCVQTIHETMLISRMALLHLLRLHGLHALTSGK